MGRRARSTESRAADIALGERIARMRKERGFTQVELAARLGVIQVIVSDYERGRLRPNHEVLVKLAAILDVSTDELLGVARAPKMKGLGDGPNRRFLRRMELISKLPKRDQDALIRTIDAFLAARKQG
jgi:transcriptional regulator with XRE-family HTH domain